MKITDEAKKIIKEALVSNDCDCLKVMQKKSCCGTSLYFTLVKKKEAENSITIDGISVLIDNETLERAETVTIKAKNGELLIHDDASSGCC